MTTTSHIRIGEACVWRPCHRCRRHTLTARTGGLLTHCDPENLSIGGEIAALLQSRLTFDIHVLGLPRRMFLEYRDTVRIKGSRGYPVVAQHSCGSELAVRMSAALDEVREIVIPFGKGFPDVPLF